MLTVSSGPDVDREVHYNGWRDTIGKCRMRAWQDTKLVVVTNLDENPGVSVTNAIENIAVIVEAQLGIDLLDVEWSLVEHYHSSEARGRRRASLYLVRFERRDSNGRLVRPRWNLLDNPRLIASLA